MLIEIIKQYLGRHKRLVVPQLGAFIVKEGEGTVLFSEMLRRDDGVLRGLMVEAGRSEVEAAGEIQRFVFEVRHDIEHKGEHMLAGFGVMTAGANSTITFRYDITAGAAPAAEPPEKAEPASGLGSAPRDGAAAREQHDRVVEAVRNAFAQPYVSPSAKMNPDPSVKGLRYGKPPKNTDAYAYVDRAPRRRVDWFIWLAVAVAAVALAAIAFGYWRDVERERAETEYMEEVMPVEMPRELPAVPAEPAENMEQQ